RPHGLCGEPDRALPPCRRVRRTTAHGRARRRPSGGAAHQVRPHHQPPGGEGARTHAAAVVADPCRRGHRLMAADASERPGARCKLPPPYGSPPKPVRRGPPSTPPPPAPPAPTPAAPPAPAPAAPPDSAPAGTAERGTHAPAPRAHRGRLFRKYLLLILTLV